jgi:hypothetical protein
MPNQMVYVNDEDYAELIRLKKDGVDISALFVVGLHEYIKNKASSDSITNKDMISNDKTNELRIETSLDIDKYIAGKIAIGIFNDTTAQIWRAQIETHLEKWRAVIIDGATNKIIAYER